MMDDWHWDDRQPVAGFLGAVAILVGISVAIVWAVWI